jgi:voltage-gated potassium channel Kch
MSRQPGAATIDSGLRRHADKLLAMSAALLIVVGTVVYSAIEHWSWIDSLYFSVVAVTTVGFGDLTPSTDGSKLFTVFYVLSGIAIISAWLSERLRRRGLVAQSRRSD